MLFILHKCNTIQYKNLGFANRSRVSCAHNTLRASIGINITVEFNLYPTVGTVLIHSVKPELTE